LDGYVLNYDILRKYQEAEKEYLKSLGLNDEAINRYFE
jgi:uncharacterized protein YozE (UPF0346 family)